jgi:translation initiation factor 5A
MSTRQVNASTVKEGDTILIEGVPCKIVSVQKSKPGKHGAAKARMVGIGIFDEKKRDVVMPGSDRVEVPLVEKRSAQVLSITGDDANVMDMETYEAFDLKIPEELKSTVHDGIQILYWVILDQKLMKQVKGESS